MSTIRCVNVLIRGIFTYCLSFYVLEWVFGEITPMQLTLLKHVLRPSFMDWTCLFIWKRFFQGFSTADKMSTTVVEFPEYNESYSVSGNDCKGEGGDFVLE